jgi:hypothetical protein
MRKKKEKAVVGKEESLEELWGRLGKTGVRQPQAESAQMIKGVIDREGFGRMFRV